jgi:hypothetical protein
MWGMPGIALEKAEGFGIRDFKVLIEKQKQRQRLLLFLDEK